MRTQAGEIQLIKRLEELAIEASELRSKLKYSEAYIDILKMDKERLQLMLNAFYIKNSKGEWIMSSQYEGKEGWIILPPLHLNSHINMTRTEVQEWIEMVVIQLLKERIS